MVACRILFSFLGERRQARDEREGRVRGGAPSSPVCLALLALEKMQKQIDACSAR